MLNALRLVDGFDPALFPNAAGFPFIYCNLLSMKLVICNFYAQLENMSTLVNCETGKILNFLRNSNKLLFIKGNYNLVKK
jgi:hypothetical protein